MVSKLSQKLIANTTYLTLDWVFATILSLIYWIISGKFLSKDQYGIVSTVNGLVPFVSMLSMLGLSLAIMKLVPEYLVNRKNKIKPMIRYSFKLVTITNFAILILFLLFSNQLASIFKINTVTVSLSAIGIFSMSLFFMSGSVIYGFQNMRKYFTSDLFGQIAKVALTILTIYLGFMFYGPIIGLLAGYLVSLVLRFDLEWFRNSSDGLDREVLFKYAKPALISILLSSVFTYYQYFLLPVVQDQSINGLFSVALRITSLIAMVQYILIGGLFPILSKLSAVENSRRLQGILVSSVFRYTLFIVLPLAAFAIIFAKPLIILFSQAQFLDATSLFPILTIASVVYGLGTIYSQTLYAIKRPILFRNIVITTLVVFIGTSLPFAYFYSSIGLAISYLLSASILFILSYLFTYRNIPFNINTYNIFKIIPATILFSIILIASGISNLFVIKIILILFSFLAYIFILKILGFYTSQDIKIIRFVGGKVQFIRKPMNILADFLSKN
jgi:O-antigen/teichoic acid export membrane protein